MSDAGARSKVTVVIPTKDRLALVQRALRSALAQDGVTMRAVVVDDGSAETTARALDALAGPRVRVVHHAHSLGVSAARNAGLALVETPWVAFLDDDDFWAPDKIRSQLDALEATPAARWSTAGAVHVDGDQRPLFWQEPPPQAEMRHVLARTGGVPGGGSGVLVSTAVARAVGGFDPGLSILADWDFYYRLSLLSPVAPVNRPLIGYYRHRGSMFHDAERLTGELLALDAKHRDGDAPLQLDYPHWAVQLVIMSLRARNLRSLSCTLSSDIVARAGKASLLRLALGRARRGVAGEHRGRPAAWCDEPLGWLQCPAVDDDPRAAGWAFG
jgi:glycosyltransferase involved in cell wall biosynthesis